MSSNVIEAAAGRRREIFAAISSANGTDDAVQAAGGTATDGGHRR